MREEIRIGLIGAAGRAQLARHWQRPGEGGSRVVAAADVSPDALAAFRDWADPGAATTADFHELVARDNLDAVAVFSPDRFHEEHALAVLNAGKHLFLEKPMALSTEGCDRILQAWRSAGTRFMIGFNMRYMPVLEQAKALVEDGAIGPLKAIWMRHFVGAGSDFYFHDWHALRANCNSLLLQKASHDFDVIHWFANSYTDRVSAFGSLDYFGGSDHDPDTCPECRGDADRATETQAPDNPRQLCPFRNEVDIEDNQVVILELANGIKASYSQCHFTPEYLRNYTFIGTEGRLEIEVERNRLRLIKRPHSRTWENDPPPHTDYPIDVGGEGHGGADPRIAQAFLDLVQLGRPPASDPVAGRMSVAVGCEAARSLRGGGVRTLPALGADVTDRTLQNTP